MGDSKWKRPRKQPVGLPRTSIREALGGGGTAGRGKRWIDAKETSASLGNWTGDEAVRMGMELGRIMVTKWGVWTVGECWA